MAPEQRDGSKETGGPAGAPVPDVKRKEQAIKELLGSMAGSPPRRPTSSRRHRRDRGKPQACPAKKGGPKQAEYKCHNQAKRRIIESNRGEFVALNTQKKDRRTIEEIQIDIKKRKAGGHVEKTGAKEKDEEDFASLQNAIYEDLLNEADK